MWSPFVYLTVTILDTFNIVTEGFFLVEYGDLEVDYINPIDLCNKLNPWILPQMYLQAFITLFLLLTGHWISFLFCVPMTAYNTVLVLNNQHVLDATEIFKTVNKNKRDAFIKLVVQVLLFFYFLFHAIVSFIGWEA